MQIHCSVPQCTKKGYLKDQGTKVSYFKFPAKNLKKRLHTIRGEKGKRFKVTEMTKHKLIFIEKEAFLRKIIDNYNKISKLKQEIDKLKGQLQDTQQQSDVIHERMVNFENCWLKIPMLLFY